MEAFLRLIRKTRTRKRNRSGFSGRREQIKYPCKKWTEINKNGQNAGKTRFDDYPKKIIDSQ